MLARIKQTDLSVPVRRGDWFYYARTEEGKQYPIQCRRKGSMETAEEVLLDLNELAKGKAYAGLGAFVLSDDQNLLGLHDRLPRIPPVLASGKRSAQRSNVAGHCRPSHFPGMGRRQQDLVPDYRGSR